MIISEQIYSSLEIHKGKLDYDKKFEIINEVP